MQVSCVADQKVPQRTFAAVVEWQTHQLEVLAVF
jgi:hypothetical protein